MWQRRRVKVLRPPKLARRVRGSVGGLMCVPTEACAACARQRRRVKVRARRSLRGLVRGSVGGFRLYRVTVLTR